MKPDPSPLALIAMIAVFLLLLYWGAAAIVFEFRHPMANRMVLVTHVWSVLTFSTVAEFQPRSH